jgi:hypothetical protein
MSRAALLPTPGDPYIIAAWLNLYNRVWKNEVDKLYIHLNSRLEDPVMDYVKDLCQQCNADVTFTKSWMGHGQALKVIYDKCSEENILLIEDDAYITKPGVVDSAFKYVEDNQVDCVVTTRGSCTESLRIKEAEVFNLTGELFWKPNFWPCFFFSKKETIKDCNNLATFDIEAGTHIEELNWVAPEHISMDTFGKVSMELRKKNLRFLCIHDGRSTTEDMWLSEQKQGIFASPPIAPWIHFGSTSSGISYSLLDKDLKPLENRLNSNPVKLPVMQDDHIKDDYERRISLWFLCYKYFPIPESSPAFYFNKVYRESLERLIGVCDLNRTRLNKYIDIYTELLGPMWKR